MTDKRTDGWTDRDEGLANHRAMAQVALIHSVARQKCQKHYISLVASCFTIQRFFTTVIISRELHVFGRVTVGVTFIIGNSGWGKIIIDHPLGLHPL